MQVVLYRNGGGFARPFLKKISPPPGAGMPGAKIRVRLSKKSRPADMCGWTGHLQGNLALRVCEPLCGECAVQRQILSPGGYQGEGISVPRMRAEMGSPWSVELLRHAEFRMHAPQGPRSRSNGNNQNTVYGGLSIPHSPVFSAPRPDSRGPSR